MSLNGLDDPKVKEAHETALAEPGGWFLLKYASRDELDLFGRGNGGIVEIRNNIGQYEEASPLYGFLRYRRRNVLIKYLPEDCSRLVQARTTVHFNVVCDRFAPCDTAFTIASAKELKDTKLSAACSLHTASGSTSSSTSSLRRRRLMEIAEEEEEEERERKRQSVTSEPGERPKTAAGGDPTAKPLTLDSDLANSPEASNFTGKAEPPEFTGVRPASPAKSFDDAARRMSSQSGRPDLYSYSSYPYSKPKVKLGPRPSLDTGGRPRTSAGGNAYRPISSIPAGLKTHSTKGGKKGRAEGKTDSGMESPIKEEGEINFLATSIPIPENSPLETEPPRPHASSGAHGTITSGVALNSNIPSLPPSLPSSLQPPATKQNTMTPEKLRLMKAMKLREQKKKKQLEGQQASSDAPSTEMPEEPASSDSIPEQSEVVDDAPVDPDQVAVEVEQQLGDRLSISKADSGIGIEVGNDGASIDTRTDSHPASPTAGSSDVGDSTKASSFSESTDETVRPGEEKEDPAVADDEMGEPNGQHALQEQTIAERVGQDAPAAEHEQELGAAENEASMVTEQPLEQNIVVHQPIEAIDDKVVDPVEEKPIVQENSEAGSSAPLQKLPISKFSASSPTTTTSQIPATEQESDFATGNAAAGNLATAADIPEPEHAASDNPTENAAQPLELKIPVSRFSTQEPKSPTTNPTSPPIPSIVAPTSQTESEPNEPAAIAEGAPEKEAGDNKEKLVEPDQASDVASIDVKQSRRRAAIEPIRTDLDIDKRNSLANISDDDALMDELQSATVQEAKPMVVTKSPMTANFPGTSPIKRAQTVADPMGNTLRIVRTTSNPIRGPLLMPGDVTTSSARAVSSGAAYLHKITSQQNAAELKPKTGKLGSSISQRIKALEKLSGSAGGAPVPDATPAARPSSTFFSVRKVNTREPSRSPSVMDRTNSLTRAATPSPPESRESSPGTERVMKRERSGSISNRLTMFEGGNLPRGRPESIQVTARIVREPGQMFPRAPEPKADPADFVPLDLKQSRLLVDHQKATPATSPAPTPEPVAQPAKASDLERKPSLLQRRFSSKGRRSQSHDRVNEEANEEKRQEEVEPTEAEVTRSRRRSSLTVVKDFIKDRRDSLRGIMSPSADNLGLTLSTGAPNLASPSIPTPSRSPSRPPSVHQNTTNMSLSQRLSFSSRRSSIDAKSPGFPTNGRAPSIMTEGSVDSDTESRTSEKKSASGSNAGSAATSPNPNATPTSKSSSNSRATRFMRRLSNSLGGNRKNVTPAISPTVAEEDAAEVEAALAAASAAKQQHQHLAVQNSANAPSIAAYMGDVNVQFPDNLLWKRRTLCLDSQGFLLLSANPQGATSMTSTSGTRERGAPTGVKRYHMSEFRQPFAPEIEVQEMPYSVVLDFVEGSGLQVACEDRAGQLNVLHILQDAHASHTSYGQ